MSNGHRHLLYHLKPTDRPIVRFEFLVIEVLRELGLIRVEETQEPTQFFTQLMYLACAMASCEIKDVHSDCHTCSTGKSAEQGIQFSFLEPLLDVGHGTMVKA